MKYTATLTANSTPVLLCDVVKPQGLTTWSASVFASGTFGGGTVKLQASADMGVTLVDLRDTTNVVPAWTANDMYNLSLGNAAKNGEAIKLYAVVTGATTPAIAVTLFDNR